MSRDRLPALFGKGLLYALLYLFSWVPFPHHGPDATGVDPVSAAVVEHDCMVQVDPSPGRSVMLTVNGRTGRVELRPQPADPPAGWVLQEHDELTDQKSGFYGWCRRAPVR